MTRSFFVGLGLCFSALPVAAQRAAPSGVTRDAWQRRGWIDAGVGVGTWPSGSLAATAAGWYSVGPVVAGVRLGTSGQWIGEQRSDQAFLIGGRTDGNRAFLLGAAGFARVKSFRSCDGCGSTYRPTTTQLAYTFEANANVGFAGVGAVMFGVLGPSTVHYNAFALVLNVGWFDP